MDLFTRSLWGLPLESGGGGGEKGAEVRAPHGDAQLGQGATGATSGLPPGFPARPAEPVPGKGEERRAGLLGGSPRSAPPSSSGVLLTDSVSI